MSQALLSLSYDCLWLKLREPSSMKIYIRHKWVWRAFVFVTQQQQQQQKGRNMFRKDVSMSLVNCIISAIYLSSHEHAGNNVNIYAEQVSHSNFSSSGGPICIKIQMLSKQTLTLVQILLGNNLDHDEFCLIVPIKFIHRKFSIERWTCWSKWQKCSFLGSQRDQRWFCLVLESNRYDQYRTVLKYHFHHHVVVMTILRTPCGLFWIRYNIVRHDILYAWNEKTVRTVIYAES